MKRNLYRTCIALLLVFMFGLLLSFTLANRKEIQIQKIKIGTTRIMVERLMGSKGDKRPVSCNCEDPSMTVSEDHYSYKGNGSLWYGRFEDHINVCYNENVVCSLYRSGL